MKGAAPVARVMQSEPTHRVQVFSYDSQPPTVTLEAPVGWQPTSVIVTATATDGESGVDDFLHSLDGADATDCAGTVGVGVDGTHVVEAWATDNAGNTSQHETATVYVEIIRNTPFIVQLFYVYFGLVTVGVNLEAFSVAIITLTLNCGAYCTEIIRAGIQSIHRGQTEAGLSLGMRPWQVFRYVILMPTLRVVWPPLASQLGQ